VENSTLTKPSQSPCTEPPLTPVELIEEWLPKLAVNAGAALDAKTQAVYRTIWIEGLGDLSLQVLRAAFQKTLRECAYWPVKVADIRKHVTRAENTAIDEVAEEAWARILEIRRLHWNPDLPGPLDRALARLSDRVRQAARAAGIFRDFTAPEFEKGALHTWGKKRFVESFIAYGELRQDEFLLPDGEIKNLLSEFAQTKMLRAPSQDWSKCRSRGEAYREQLATQGAPDLLPEQRLRIADELAAAARKLLDQAPRHVVTVSDQTREAIRRQAEIIKSRYPTSDTPEHLRRYILEPAAPIAQRVEDVSP
jgi:hypothetical protein